MLEDLHLLGYRPEDGSWESNGRRTFSHDEDATRAVLRILNGILSRHGFDRDLSQLWVYRHSSGEIIEIEPGGADCQGHYLHHMKAAVIA